MAFGSHCLARLGYLCSLLTVRLAVLLQWRRYTASRFRLVGLPEGDHYFVSTHFREVGFEPCSIRYRKEGPPSTPASARTRSVRRRRWVDERAAVGAAHPNPTPAPHLPCSLPCPQVTAEVGQECLKLQEQMRGGLLGAGHSWVASPLELAAAPEASSEAGGSDAAQPAAARQPGLLHWAVGGLWSAVEGAGDALAAEAISVRLTGAVLAVVGALLLWWHWLLRQFR